MITRLIIGVFMLFVASPAWAGFGMVVDAGGIPPAAGCADNELVLGSTTETTGTYATINANSMVYGGAAITEVTECSIDTLAVHVNHEWANGNCKLALYEDANADNTYELVASSAGKNVDTGWFIESITSYTAVFTRSYIIGMICDNYVRVTLNTADNYVTNDTGTYASPPSTITSGAHDGMSEYATH